MKMVLSINNGQNRKLRGERERERESRRVVGVEKGR